VKDLNDATACDFVYGFDIQAIFDTESDVIGEERIRVERLSSCAYRWFNDVNGIEEHLELRIEARSEDRVKSFTEDLEQVLETGELRHPMKPEIGRFEYELIEGPGDMTIWSPNARALKWHLGDNYYFIMNLDENTSPRGAEDDLARLMQLADQVNNRMGIK